MTSLSTKQVLQALVVLHLDYCPGIWSIATKRDIVKLQLAQNRAAPLALKCTRRANINNMHVKLSWLQIEKRLTASLLVFLRGIDLLKVPIGLFKRLAHPCIPHKTCHEVFSQSS